MGIALCGLQFGLAGNDETEPRNPFNAFVG